MSLSGLDQARVIDFLNVSVGYTAIAGSPYTATLATPFSAGTIQQGHFRLTTTVPSSTTIGVEIASGQNYIQGTGTTGSNTVNTGIFYTTGNSGLFTTAIYQTPIFTGTISNGTPLTHINLPAANILGLELWDSGNTPVRWWWAQLSVTIPANSTITFATGSLTGSIVGHPPPGPSLNTQPLAGLDSTRIVDYLNVSTGYYASAGNGYQAALTTPFSSSSTNQGRILLMVTTPTDISPGQELSSGGGYVAGTGFLYATGATGPFTAASYQSINGLIENTNAAIQLNNLPAFALLGAELWDSGSNRWWWWVAPRPTLNVASGNRVVFSPNALQANLFA